MAIADYVAIKLPLSLFPTLPTFCSFSGLDWHDLYR